MARRKRSPAVKKAKVKVEGKARKMTFRGGGIDGYWELITTPVPKNIKMNMGRDNYFLSLSDPSIYEYDPDRAFVPERKWL
jgi:hypothetical protein